MAGLAEALRDIHRAGVVHRDLKPSNVLLAEDGPKVIDFGISRPNDSELRTETGKLIGTPPFMAPEQFRRPREVGPAADVFALGSVMVHAATGRGPFDSDSPYLVAYQVVHDEPDLTGVPDDPRSADRALSGQGTRGTADPRRVDEGAAVGLRLVRHPGVHSASSGGPEPESGTVSRPATLPRRRTAARPVHRPKKRARAAPPTPHTPESPGSRCNRRHPSAACPDRRRCPGRRPSRSQRRPSACTSLSDGGDLSARSASTASSAVHGFKPWARELGGGSGDSAAVMPTCSSGGGCPALRGGRRARRLRRSARRRACCGPQVHRRRQ